MSVSVVFSRSVSSATTRSFSDLSIPSPPFAHAAKAACAIAREVRLGWASASRLPAVFGGLCASLRRYRLGLLLQLFDDPPRPRRIDVDAGAHRARQRDRANVSALRGARLGADDLLQQRRVVLGEQALVEALLADRDVDVRAPIGAVLELAGLRLANGLADLVRHRARLRVRHLPARAEDAAEPADDAHLIRRRDRHIEVVEAALDLRREVGRADDVRSSLLGLARLVALGEDGDPDVAARAVREHERAAQLLVGVADVQAEPEVDLDGLVELDAVEALQHPDRLDRRVRLLAIDLAARLAIALSMFHRSVSTPMLRAVPATIFIACSTSRALRSSSFVSAICWTCARVRRPTFSRFGSPEPFSRFSASLISTAAGGVFVMNVNDRSSKTVISTGMMRPFSCAVCALKALQNSMMLTPCWPSAGPTGGAGFACPPGICSLISVRTFFAMSVQLLHLVEGELDGNLALEDVDEHL